MPKEFIINSNLTLILEDGKTNIYIKGKLFQQCKFLLISIPLDDHEAYTNVGSIDEAAEILDTSLEGANIKRYNISPEEEFWTHCSVKEELKVYFLYVITFLSYFYK